ncbi:hypothetical protein GCM10022226_76490 [Sphaerisporangium flaviroseum]|uniref:Uncharacterized protein n=1 Tax=Sphaerisporangium flaviroseum TaxID=509199 RepID=A0ABP7JDS8_9ACTN
MRARSGDKKSGKAAKTKTSLPQPGVTLPGFPQPVLRPGVIQGSSQPERHLPPAPRRIPVPPAPVRRVTPPRRQPKGR